MTVSSRGCLGGSGDSAWCPLASQAMATTLCARGTAWEPSRAPELATAGRMGHAGHRRLTWAPQVPLRRGELPRLRLGEGTWAAHLV